MNYIRNSVKATVDAYDGSVTLYAWDAEDPILKAWNRSRSRRRSSRCPSIDGDLMSHLRYPEDLFKVQRNLLARYHVTDAGQFFSGNDFWANPNDPTSSVAVPQPPYYLTLQMPDQDAGQLLADVDVHPDRHQRAQRADRVPGGRRGRGQRGREAVGGLRQDAPARAATRLDGARTRPGEQQLRRRPGRVQRAQHPRPWRLAGGPRQPADPAHGRRPAVRAAGLRPGAGPAPRSRCCSACSSAFGDDIGFADTLDGALDQVFGGDSGADAGDAGTDPDAGHATDATHRPTEPTDGATPAPSRPATDTGTDATARADLDRALQQAKQAIADSQAALARSTTSPPTARRRSGSTRPSRAPLEAEARLGE